MCNYWKFLLNVASMRTQKQVLDRINLWTLTIYNLFQNEENKIIFHQNFYVCFVHAIAKKMQMIYIDTRKKYIREEEKKRQTTFTVLAMITRDWFVVENRVQYRKYSVVLLHRYANIHRVNHRSPLDNPMVVINETNICEDFRYDTMIVVRQDIDRVLH